jgi:prepilin-type N-terminal cleavage/methylation domain-containing protein/prepilin-type processing-associated H-X9-DG protein
MLKKQKAFTLIELLVVIAIIALLMSILMPALNKVKEQGKKVKCQAQQRQYGLAIQMYANDNGQAIPFFAPYFSGGAIDANTAWYGQCAKYMGIKQVPGESIAAALANVRRCPSGKRDYSPNFDGLDHWNGWIGVNYDAWNTSGHRTNSPFIYGKQGRDVTDPGLISDPVVITGIKRPGSWLMLLDVQYYFVYNPISEWWILDDDRDGDNINDTCGACPMIYNGANPKIHNNGCNITLADGHVEWVAFKDLWKTNTAKEVVNPYWYGK